MLWIVLHNRQIYILLRKVYSFEKRLTRTLRRAAGI